MWTHPESQRLGRLFDDGDRILFEYDEQFLASKLEPSPLTAAIALALQWPLNKHDTE